MAMYANLFYPVPRKVVAGAPANLSHDAQAYPYIRGLVNEFATQAEMISARAFLGDDETMEDMLARLAAEASGESRLVANGTAITKDLYSYLLNLDEVPTYPGGKLQSALELGKFMKETLEFIEVKDLYSYLLNLEQQQQQIIIMDEVPTYPGGKLQSALELGKYMKETLEFIQEHISNEERKAGLVAMCTMLTVDIDAMQPLLAFKVGHDSGLAARASSFYNVTFASHDIMHTLGATDPEEMDAFATGVRVLLSPRLAFAVEGNPKTITSILYNKDPYNILAFLRRDVSFAHRLLAILVLTLDIDTGHQTHLYKEGQNTVIRWLRETRKELNVAPALSFGTFGTYLRVLHCYLYIADTKIAAGCAGDATPHHTHIVDCFVQISSSTLKVERHIKNNNLPVMVLNAITDLAIYAKGNGMADKEGSWLGRLYNCCEQAHMMDSRLYVTYCHRIMQSLVDARSIASPRPSSRFVAAYNGERTALTSAQRRLSSLLAISTLTRRRGYDQKTVLMIGQARGSGLHPTDAHYQFLVSSDDPPRETGTFDVTDDIRAWDEFYEVRDDEGRAPLLNDSVPPPTTEGRLMLNDTDFVVLSRFVKKALIAANVFLTEANDAAFHNGTRAMCYIPDVTFSTKMNADTEAKLRSSIRDTYAVVLTTGSFDNIDEVYIGVPGSEYREEKIHNGTKYVMLLCGPATASVYTKRMRDAHQLLVVQYECEGDAYPDGRHWTIPTDDSTRDAVHVGMGVMWLGNMHVNANISTISGVGIASAIDIASATDIASNFIDTAVSVLHKHIDEVYIGDIPNDIFKRHDFPQPPWRPLPLGWRQRRTDNGTNIYFDPEAQSWITVDPRGQLALTLPQWTPEAN